MHLFVFLAQTVNATRFMPIAMNCHQSCGQRQFAKVQHAAPKFEGMAVVNGEFKKIKLDDYKGKYVVFFFYPLDL